jgi:hypothetical protein
LHKTKKIGNLATAVQSEKFACATKFANRKIWKTPFFSTFKCVCHQVTKTIILKFLKYIFKVSLNLRVSKLILLLKTDLNVHSHRSHFVDKRSSLSATLIVIDPITILTMSFVLPLKSNLHVQQISLRGQFVGKRSSLGVALMRLYHPLDGVTNLECNLLCFLTPNKIIFKEKGAFNWDRCCHLVLCLQLILFHCYQFHNNH